MLQRLLVYYKHKYNDICVLVAHERRKSIIHMYIDYYLLGMFVELHG